MNISWIAMDRNMEERVAASPGLRNRLKRPLLSMGRKMSDAELLGKLRSAGIELDKQSYRSLRAHSLSAQQIAEQMLKQPDIADKLRGTQEDWIWISLVVLWERWFPDEPSFEMLDDRIHEGYQLEEPAAACRVWLHAWPAVLHIMDRRQIGSIKQFDELFSGTYSVWSWVQDLEAELGNAAADEPECFRERIRVCQECLRLLEADDNLTREIMRRALAESHFELGEREEADALFRQWLTEDPQWGAGWVAWATCYALTEVAPEFARADSILLEGLQVSGVRERKELVFHQRVVRGLLEGEKAGRKSSQEFPPASTMSAEISGGGNVLRLKQKFDFGEEGIPLDKWVKFARSMARQAPVHRAEPEKPKVGRNAPCPCGSGKKFKKCCGRGA